MATIFKRKNKGPYIIQWFDHTGRRRERSSRTTDKRTAERIASKLEADVALWRDGVVDPRQDRFSKEDRRPLIEHVHEYTCHCEHVGMAKKTIHMKRAHLNDLLGHSGANRLSELDPNVVERHLSGLKDLNKSARTVNQNRADAVAFMNWCVKTGRVDSNPLSVIPKLDEQKDRRRIRRPLTDEELIRLLSVAEEHGRKAWYLAAILAGLRKGDLQRLTWADIDFKNNTIKVHDGKGKCEDIIPMHGQLAGELLRIRPAMVRPKAKVFPIAVTDVTRRKDFQRAGIPLVDEEGRVVDLHALRTTLGTRLAQHGAMPQVARQIMRHSDYQTTLTTYTRCSD